MKVAITVGCAAAMTLAAVLVVRLRGTRRTPSPLSGQDPLRTRLSTTVARTGGMLVGAYLAGVLTIGAGSRLLMRVLAATSAEGAQGVRTEADEVVGQVSGEGTMFLVSTVGLGAGVVGLALFALLRRWLPDRSLAAGLVGVAIGAGLLVRPTGLLTADNRDFTILAPVGLAVALCLVTLALFGATFGVLVDRLAPRWPRPALSPRGVGSLLPFVPLALAPPLLVAVVIAVVVGTVAPRLRSPAPPALPGTLPVDGPRLPPGRAVVGALGGIGCLSVVLAAGQVLVL